MLNMCDILLSEAYHSSNIYTFRNRSLLNNDIPILGEYLNYCIRTSIRFLILIFLEIKYKYFISFATLMENASLVILLITLLNKVFVALPSSSRQHVGY